MPKEETMPAFFDTYLRGAASLTHDEQIARFNLIAELRASGLCPDALPSKEGQTLPGSYTISLTLDKRYGALTELPPLPTLASLRLENLPLIKSLPNRLTLLNGLIISGCESLETVSDTVSVCGDVEFVDCPKLISFPPAIAATGSLFIRGHFPALCLPPALTVAKDLEIGEDPTRTVLFNQEVPPSLGNLVIRQMASLKILNLPEDLPGNLRIENCAALESLGDVLAVGKSVVTASCPGLRLLASRANIGGDLSVSGCSQLEMICEVLRVGGDLTLDQLPNLRVLVCDVKKDEPASMPLPRGDLSSTSVVVSRVEKSVIISQAPKFGWFSETLRIGENLKVVACKTLRSLPFSLFGWPEETQVAHSVTLTHTGIDWISDCERLERLVPRATLLFRSDSGNPSSVYETYRVSKLKLPEMLSFFHKEADAILGVRKSRSNKWLDTVVSRQRGDLRTFLSKLADTQDLSPSQEVRPGEDSSTPVRNRQHLVLRISAFLDRLSKMSTEWDELFTEIAHAVGGCEDRVLQSFGHCERYLLVYDVLQADTEKEKRLLELAGGLFRLDLVHQWAFRHLREHNLRLCESSEAMLYLECKLRVSLKLPVRSYSMNYPQAAGILGKAADQAFLDVTAIARAPGEFEKFLVTWEPWQKYQRQKVAAKIHFSSLPLIGLGKEIIDGICPLTLEPREALKNPVALPFENTHHIFELNDLLTWWTQNPRHPLLLSPLPDLAQLVRLR